MNAQVKVFLLGPFRVERAGQPLTRFKSNKVRALLAYLAVERASPQHRDVLAGLLWPESTNRRALALLRDVLSNLRSVLGDRNAETPIIQVEGDTLRINPKALWLDVAMFSILTAEGSDERALAQAVTLYRGDFLEGFTLSNSPDFEAWALLQRETFQGLMLNALYRLTTLYLQRGDYTAAQASARRQLALDHYREEAHRQLLRALTLAGHRNQALHHYADYCTLLREELDIAPDTRTTALYQRIRDRRLQPSVAKSLLWQTGEPLAHQQAGKPTAPFVGRAAELERLEVTLQKAQQGAGQVIFVTGEAGSGKTMLVQAFTHRILARADDIVVARGACNAQIGTGDPYLPFREILRLLTGDFNVPATGGTLAPAYAQRLETFVPTARRALEEEGPDLIAWGGLSSQQTRRPAPRSPKTSEAPQSQQASSPSPTTKHVPQPPAVLCDQVTRVLRAAAQKCVLVLVLDDLQWADSGTLNLLAHLGRRLRGSRILIIGITRPVEFDPDHTLLPVVRELQRIHGNITLDLDQAGGQAFVDAFLDSMPNTLNAAFRAHLVQQTGGHALFTAALVKQMQDYGALVQDAAGHWSVGAYLDWSRLPPRVEAVIAERLARLPDPWQDLLAAASVEGETFTAAVVAQALGEDTAQVTQALRALGDSVLSGAQHNLVHALGLERVGDRRVARYRFRHALFQQYLYMHLGPVQRAQLHEAIAYALEDLYAGQRDEGSSRLAYHFEAAGLIEAAVDALLQAGQRAYRLSAPLEAIHAYRRGLALVAQSPHSATRDRLELALQMHLDAPLLVTQGWGAPERATILQRAYTLAQQLEDTDRLLIILYTLADLSTALAKHDQALAYAEQLLALAQQTGDRAYEALGYRMTGTTHFFLGYYPEARAQLESGLACYAAVLHQGQGASSAPIERAVFLWAWLPHILLALGYPEQAVASSQEALDCVRPDGPAQAQAIMLTISGMTFQAMLRQPQATLRYAEELLSLAKYYELAAFEGWATFCRGWARTMLGSPQAGLPDMAKGWEGLKATGTQGTLSPLLTLWAEAALESGEIEHSEALLKQALTRAEQHSEVSSLAETYRVQGKVLLRKPGAEAQEEAAEACFMRAIDMAQEQSAKLWELRATVELARLWEGQGRVADAYARLSQVYDWFTEGMDTPDLVTARELLARLDMEG